MNSRRKLLGFEVDADAFSAPGAVRHRPARKSHQRIR